MTLYDVRSIYELLGKSAVIHIYSFPNFILESILCLAMCLMYLFLHCNVSILENLVQITKIRDNVSNISGNNSVSTICTQFHHENMISRSKTPTSWPPYSNQIIGNGFLKSIPKERMRYIDNLITLTPTEFVNIDRERRMRDQKMSGCLKSLTSLCESAIYKKESRATLLKHIELARQHAECAKNSTQNNLYLNTTYMTRSFFDLMEQLVTKSSLDNPIPFKGDFTGLALDAGNLNPLGSDSIGAFRKTSSDTSIKSEDLFTDDLQQELDYDDLGSINKYGTIVEEFKEYIENSV